MFGAALDDQQIILDLGLGDVVDGQGIAVSEIELHVTVDVAGVRQDVCFATQIADLQHATHAESSVGFRRGKVLLVDMEKYEISRWQAFSDPVFARTPEEVGTVVQLNFDFSDVGEYEDGTIALEQQLDAVVIDLRAGTIVGHLHVSAPPCPEVINHAGRAKSYVEGREVVRAVHSLPVRPD